MPEKWEYISATLELAWKDEGLNVKGITNHEKFKQYLKGMGEQGWELVSVVPMNKDGTTVVLGYFFKRYVWHSYSK